MLSTTGLSPSLWNPVYCGQPQPGPEASGQKLAGFFLYLITVSPGVRASTLPFESYQRPDSTKFLSILSTSYRDITTPRVYDTPFRRWYRFFPMPS